MAGTGSCPGQTVTRSLGRGRLTSFAHDDAPHTLPQLAFIFIQAGEASPHEPTVTIESCRHVGSCVDSSQHSVWRCCSASPSALPVRILPVRFPRLSSVSSYS